MCPCSAHSVSVPAPAAKVGVAAKLEEENVLLLALANLFPAGEVWLLLIMCST